MQHELNSRFQAVEAYVTKARASTVPEEIQSYLFRFGTVLICGYIERSIEIIILGRLDRRAQPRILSFIKSLFKRGTNYDCHAIEDLLSRFDQDWKESFCIFIDKNPDIKDGVHSCYSVRNSVAHGGTGSVGSARLLELMQVSKRLIDGVVESTSDSARKIRQNRSDTSKRHNKK